MTKKSRQKLKYCFRLQPRRLLEDFTIANHRHTAINYSHSVHPLSFWGVLNLLPNVQKSGGGGLDTALIFRVVLENPIFRREWEVTKTNNMEGGLPKKGRVLE